MFTEEDYQRICGVVSLGCGLETAAFSLSMPVEKLIDHLQNNPDTAMRVRRSLALAEVAHMKDVCNATQDPKNWKASVWWLERCVPERYARRDLHGATQRQLQAFIADVAAAIERHVHDPLDRRRLLERLEELAGAHALTEFTPATQLDALDIDIDTLAEEQEHDICSDQSGADGDANAEGDDTADVTDRDQPQPEELS